MRRGRLDMGTLKHKHKSNQLSKLQREFSELKKLTSKLKESSVAHFSQEIADNAGRSAEGPGRET